jgi:hypothetical protein
MMLERPILAFVEGVLPNSELKGMIQRTRVGCCYEMAEDNYSEMKDYILNLYNGTLKFNPNIEEIEQYNYKNIAKQILEALEMK